jgi:uncharacterized membrane protein YqgA involved in biofilm formation
VAEANQAERNSATMRGLDTLLNVAAIAAGASVGTLLGDRLPERLRDTLVAGLGLFTLVLGVQQALAAFGDELAGAVGRSAPLVVLGALLAGGLAGEAVGLEGRLERLGEAVRRRLGGRASFVEGFVLASLVACVGPLAVLGAFADGLRGDLSLLAVKSLLDGFAMLAFASYLGWGVAASGLAVLAYQGGLTALAAVLEQVMTPAVVAAMTAVGGLLVIAIGLRLLGLARIRVANLLPAVLLAPLATGLLAAIERP